jgi:hypothetical protein
MVFGGNRSVHGKVCSFRVCRDNNIMSDRQRGAGYARFRAAWPQFLARHHRFGAALVSHFFSSHRSAREHNRSRVERDRK